MNEVTISGEDALKQLKEGNARFLEGKARFPTVQKEILADLAKGQSPYATILSCSDSRVPPELIFDAGFGELFVIRVAGNVFSAEIAGTLQYAGRHLQTPLFVVMGHTHCGAIHAAVDCWLHGKQQHSHIQLLLDSILPGITNLDPHTAPAALVEQAVEANVRWTIRQILNTPEAQEKHARGAVKLVGAVYDIESGRITFLD